jgi:phosphoglycerol transferase
VTAALRRRGGAPTDKVFPVANWLAAVQAATVAAMAWVWAAVAYRLWDASLRVPLYQDQSDARLIANLIKNTIDHGWYQTNPHLGAPFGQELYDFPHGGETWQLTAIKGLSLFIKDYGLLMNVYYLAGFGLTAAAAFLVLRHLRFSYWASAVMSLVYTFLPFHMAHGESHMFRSSYWFAPLACLVLLWSMQWRERFLVDPNPPSGPDRWSTLKWNLAHNLRRRRVLAIVVICVLLGGTETMTTCFTMVLLALTGLIGAIREREAVRLLVSGALIAVLAATFLVLLYPTFNYVRTYGQNDLAARRQVTEQERYGLKISRMVLPDPSHRNLTLQRLGYRAQVNSPVPSESGQALTIIGTLGFLAALWRIVTRGWGRRDPATRHELRAVADRSAVLDNGALVILLATLLGTIGGFAVVISLAGFSQIRVWDRIVVIIAFFAFAFAAHAFDKVAGWLRGVLTWPAPFVVGLAIAVGAFGLWDATVPTKRDYPAMDHDFENDRAFVQAIERSVPDGTMVFQLPVVPFPEEPPPGTMLDYDQLRPFLQSDGSTDWSYGKVKGRPNADWQWMKVRDTYGIVRSLPALAGLGFRGLYVDLDGYGPKGPEVRAALRRTLGVDPLVSPNGRMLFYDMRPYVEGLDKTPAQLRTLARHMLGVVAPDPS